MHVDRDLKFFSSGRVQGFRGENGAAIPSVVAYSPNWIDEFLQLDEAFDLRPQNLYIVYVSEVAARFNVYSDVKCMLHSVS